MSMIHNIIHTSYNRMHGNGAVRYAMYAVTITKLELLRTNPSFGEVRAEVFFLVEGRGAALEICILLLLLLFSD